MRIESVKRRILAVLAVLLFAASVLCGANAVREYKSRTKDSDDFKALARLVEIVPIEPSETTETKEIEGTIHTFIPNGVDSTVKPTGTAHIPENTAEIIPPDTATTQGTQYEATHTPNQIGIAETAKPSAPRLLHDIPRLIGMNGDCIGWLSIEGTAVDYPVMHTPAYPQKYLRMNFFGESSSAGVPFMDHRCDLSDDNIIIYGHNMRKGTMFAPLKNYLNREYAYSHPTIILETADGAHEFRFFAAAVVDEGDPWYGFLNAQSEDAFDKAVQRIFHRAITTYGTMPSCGDRILTLSTCHSSGSNSRLIVLAAEERPQISLRWDPNHPIFKFRIDRRG